jgi:hypothetical protein
MVKINQQNKWFTLNKNKWLNLGKKPQAKSCQEKLIVHIQPTKINCSNPDNKNQWFKSRPQIPMVQIQTTKTNGSNPDNKNHTNGEWSIAWFKCSIFTNGQNTANINQGLKLTNKNPKVHFQPTKLMGKIWPIKPMVQIQPIL